MSHETKMERSQNGVRELFVSGRNESKMELKSLITYKNLISNLTLSTYRFLIFRVSFDYLFHLEFSLSLKIILERDWSCLKISIMLVDHH